MCDNDDSLPHKPRVGSRVGAYTAMVIAITHIIATLAIAIAIAIAITIYASHAMQAMLISLYISIAREYTYNNVLLLIPTSRAVKK